MSEAKVTDHGQPQPIGQRPGGPRRYVVARTSEIGDGERLLVEVGGRALAIFNISGDYRAILQRCPHAGGPLGKGALLERVCADVPGNIRHDPDTRYLSCPWHGWLFDLETGQSWWDPAHTRARRFPVSVEHGETIAGAVDEHAAAPGPYVIERFPVSVEDDYLVVTMRPRTDGRAPTDASV